MARGWESKSIEQQQEDALRKPAAPTARALTAEERDRAQRRDQLRLALALTESEIQTACHPRHRDMLRLRLESIRAELDALS